MFFASMSDVQFWYRHTSLSVCYTICCKWSVLTYSNLDEWGKGSLKSDTLFICIYTVKTIWFLPVATGPSPRCLIEMGFFRQRTSTTRQTMLMGELSGSVSESTRHILYSVPRRRSTLIHRNCYFHN